jgi:hypothetical protein
MKSSKERYRLHCAEESTIPIFSRDWWLDAVCGDSWDAVLVERDGQIMASMPFLIERRGPLRYLSQPVLTPRLGPWIRKTESKYVTNLKNEKKLMTALIDDLPDYDRFSQCWHCSVDNWLPFFWRGFQQTTLYTYVIAHLGDEDELWQSMDAKTRNDIKKAKERFGLQVHDSENIDEFIELNQSVFERQGKSPPYSRDLVRRIDQTCSGKGVRKIWVAQDDTGRKHAAIYIVWDSANAYYLMGGGDPKLRSSAATSLLIWGAIRHAATVTRRFDFEGSMLESVERFFRGFGARQTPYFRISRTDSLLLRLKDSVDILIGRN